MAMKHRSRRKKRRQEKEALLAKKIAANPRNGIAQGRTTTVIQKFFNSQLAGLLGQTEKVKDVQAFKAEMVNFKDYVLSLSSGAKDNLLYMREATESNNIDLVTRLLENILSTNTEFAIKQKPILEGVKALCDDSDYGHVLMVGLLCQEELTSILEEWDKIVKLCKELERDFVKTMSMASEYFETQGIEKQISIGEQFIVPEGVSIS